MKWLDLRQIAKALEKREVIAHRRELVSKLREVPPEDWSYQFRHVSNQTLFEFNCERRGVPITLTLTDAGGEDAYIPTARVRIAEDGFDEKVKCAHPVSFPCVNIGRFEDKTGVFALFDSLYSSKHHKALRRQKEREAKEQLKALDHAKHNTAIDRLRGMIDKL